jgi:hypothetical protein
MTEKIRATRKMGSVDVPPPVLKDSRGRFIVLPTAESEVGGPIVYEEDGKVFMRVGDGHKSDTVIELSVGSKIKAGSPIPHTFINIEVVQG